MNAFMCDGISFAVRDEWTASFTNVLQGENHQESY